LRKLIGHRLANFEIQRLVGRGGMAEVYHGIDVKLHRPVAVKVFDVESRHKSAQSSRFIQEARMMAKWRHENIIQIYYAGDETGLFYYVMEYVDGYNLASIISVYKERGELMPIDDVLRIGDSVASALDYAHKNGVIHRDVKPANVMIANDGGRVVLGDFGLALDLTDKSQGEVFGSPHYIAPEQARRSSDAVPQSDLYALGAMLYEMITGATPFNDPNPASLALQHITDAPPLPRSINPSISVQVEEVLLKALEKSPKDRYQTGKAMMSALRKAFEDGPLKPQDDIPGLPPIPVNVPTIRRSDMSLNSFTHHRDVKLALDTKTKAAQPLDDELVPEGQGNKRQRFSWLLIILLLLLIACLGLWAYRPDIMRQWPGMLTSSTAIPTQTAQIPTVDTASPEPIITIVHPTEIITEIAAPTGTETKRPTITTTKTATATVMSTNTTAAILPTVVTATPVPTQAGYLMTAYYNDTSFYILNKSNVSRSVSGFVFERIGNDGVTQQKFEGWHWEENFSNIQPNRCVSLKIYKVPDPYLDPLECDKRTLSTLFPRMDSDELFWTSDDSGDSFRILWLGEEIVRCEIEAGTCDFFVP